MSGYKRIITIVLWLLLSSASVPAQNYSIFGRVQDSERSKALAEANVKLLDERDSIVSSTISDYRGAFTLHAVEAGTYQVELSHLGYLPLRITLVDIDGDLDLGTLQLSEAPVELSEITITAPMVRQVDRWLYFPSESIRRESLDAVDLLSRMRLPELRFDLVNRTFSTLKNGALQVRIDGMQVSQKELITLHPDDVLRIEYINNPGIEYGSGVAAVLLIRTKRKHLGLQAGVELQHALSTPKGNAYSYLKWVGRRDLLQLKFSGNYLHAKGVYSDRQIIYHYPDHIEKLSSKGTPSWAKSYSGTMQLDYNRLLDESDSFFNSILKYSRSVSPATSSFCDTQRDQSPYYTEKTTKESGEHHLSLDLYLDKKLGASSNLLANLVGTYITSVYNRSYSATYTTPSMPDFLSRYDVVGNHKSLIGEVIYKQHLGDDLRLSIGTKNRLSYTLNRYTTGAEQAPISLQHINSYTYGEISGTWQWAKLSYALGLGYSFYQMKNGGELKRYGFLRPNVALSLPLSKALYLQYQLGINPMEPTLVALSDFNQPLSQYEVRIGNPDLKPYQAYANQLALSYRKGATFIQLSGYLQYNDRPFMDNAPYYDVALNRFVRSMANQNFFRHTQAKLYASQGLSDNRLYLSAYAVLNYYVSDGSKHHTEYTGFLRGASASYDRSNWGLQANYTSEITTMFNLTKQRTAPNLQLSGYYTMDRLRFTLAIQNPRMKRPNFASWLSTPALEEQVQHYHRYNNSLVTLTLSYSLSSGKSRNISKAIHNQDTDTGIVR